MASFADNLGSLFTDLTSNVTSGVVKAGSFVSGIGDWWDESGSAKFNMWNQKWGANTANALVTGALSALGSIAQTRSSSKIYDYFKQQEQYQIQNANEQARRLQLKGDIALRNLYVKHVTQQGKNELAVAAAGGQMSGSFLDSLVQNQRYNVMDERTSSIETLWAVDNARRAGYVQALSTAGAAMDYAYKQKSNAWNSLSTFVRGVSSGLLADARQNRQNQAQLNMLLQDMRGKFDMFDLIYGADVDINDKNTTLQIVNTDQSITTGGGIASELVAEPFSNSGSLIDLNLDGWKNTNPLPVTGDIVDIPLSNQAHFG